MANLFDLIFKKQQVQPLALVDTQGNALPQEEQVTGYQPKNNLFNRMTGVGDKVVDGLFGKMVDNSGVVNDNPNALQATIETPHREGGLLNDLAAGFRDNAQNSFSVNNLMPDQNKSIANRIGEGFGTAARFLNSPLGRSILVGGAIAATGGNPLQTLAYGASTGAMNQANVMKDRAYRQQLEDLGIDTSTISGYITDDAFKQITDAKQLEEQRLYRRAILDTQLQQNDIMNRLREEQFNYQKEKEKTDREQKRQDKIIDNYYKQADLDLKKQELEQKSAGKGNDLAEAEAQLQAFEDMFDKVPNKLRGSTEGALRRMTGLASTNEANFDAQRTLLFNQIARKLGGEKGVLSDQDIKRIEKALPTLSDSFAQRKAKMAAVYNLLDIKKGSNGTKKTSLPDPLGIR